MRATVALAAMTTAMVGCGDGAGTMDARVDAIVDAPADAATDAPIDATPPPWPQLWFDVHYSSAGYLGFTASDPGRSWCTYYGFLRSGCEEITDWEMCAGPLAPWITRASVTSAGQVLATRSPVDVWQGVYFAPAQFAGLDDVVLVIEASDGQRAEIPIPTHVVPPQPTIDAATYGGNTLHVTWSAQPAAASTLITLWSQHLGGYRCHVAAPQSELALTWTDMLVGDEYILTTFAPAPSIATPLGDVRVWIGGSTSSHVPPAP